jgi:hypothetical protein
MDQQPNATPETPVAPPPAQSNEQSNNLPEAHDKTTEQIHEMSNFHVSEALGVPLLSKDIGKSGQQTASSGRRAGANDRAGSFGYYSSQDRMMAAASAVMILGPLLLGALRG